MLKKAPGKFYRKMELIINPTEKHLKQIESWLIDEKDTFNEGFYFNWNIISDEFKKRRLFCLIVDNSVVGFVCWRSFDKIITFDIVEVKKDKRGLGFGRFMVEKSIDKFKSDGFLVIDLQCSPPSSKPIWKKLGFKPYIIDERESNPKMYKTLVSTLKPIDKIDGFATTIIELWDGEPYQTTNKEPNWKWKVIFDNGTKKLKKPIIFPCHYEWRIRYQVDNNILIDDKVKYFGKNEIYFGDFMIINELSNK